MGLYHFLGLLAKQAQLPPDSAFSSEESQTRQQVPATCLHTQCRTSIALLISTARLENKAWKTLIDRSALSALIPRFPINVQTFPECTHQDLGCQHWKRRKLSWVHDTTVLTTCQHQLGTSASWQLLFRKRTLQKQTGKPAGQKPHPPLHRHKRPLQTQLAQSPSSVQEVTCLGGDATPEIRVERARLEHWCHQGLVFCYQQAQGFWVGQ